MPFAVIVRKQVIDPDDQEELWYSITERPFYKLDDAMQKYNQITPKDYQMPESVSNRNGYKFIINHETKKVIKGEDFLIPVGPIGPEISMHRPLSIVRKGVHTGYQCMGLQIGWVPLIPEIV